MTRTEARALQEVLRVRVCRTCNVEYPLAREFYRETPFGAGWRRKCRRCEHESQYARERSVRALAREVEAQKLPAKWVPRLAGEEGPGGGYTEEPDGGYRFANCPDTHGMYIDPEASAAWLAFIRFFRPVRIFLLGDHVDFKAVSRFDKPPEAVFSLGEDIEACQKFLRKLRESAPSARITYLKGNHEARLTKYLWKHPEIGALLKWQGMDLPHVLGLGDYGIEWEESGGVMATPKLLIKHGNLVRSKSAYSAMAEMERNGVSGASGHTHRLGLHYRRNKVGTLVWAESGCLCNLDPDYADGQTMDWQHGCSFGSIGLTGNSFSLHTAPIVKGKVRLADRTVSA